MFLIMMNNCAYVLLTMNISTYLFSINYESLKIMFLLINEHLKILFFF